ncbi:MAG: hypothetical protein KDN22_12575 [Verrucomicrobiae bacterium]|nr:hypothetical protein [Verrucomicrobiae bacterium]
MNPSLVFGNRVASAALASIVLATSLGAQENKIVWEAYNDYRPGEFTHENASIWDLRVTDDGGPLRNIASGEELDAEVIVEAVGTPQDFGANVAANEGSPGDLFFRDYVEPGVDGLPGVQAGANELTLIFRNLDPTKRYNFRGLAVRGGSYDNRWSIYSIFGTEAEVVAHVDGSARKNIFTAATFPEAGLEPNEVVLNSGINLEGSLVGWDNIEPGPDGEFSIDAKQYTGATPYGDASTGPYAYGFAAIYLAEIESSGDLRITENPPPNVIVAEGQSVTLSITASSPEAITYQWQRAAPEESEFSDIAAAVAATYVTPALTSDDNGARYRCIATSDGFDAVSGVSELAVDGVIPTAAAQGSINFDAVYVTFSEAMKAEQLAAIANYQLTGGDVTLASVKVLDPFSVRLGTSAQQKNVALSLTVKDIEDLAGNKIDRSVAIEFKTFAMTNGVAGMEVWRNIANDPTLQILKDYPAFPDSPDVDYVTTRIDSREVYADGTQNTYGGRFRAWLIPDETAEYEFFLRADDAGEFSISQDAQFGPLDDPDRLPDVEATGNLPFDESIPSDPIALEAGKKYAVQVLWSEDNGDDVAQLAWRKAGDGDFPEEPIPSKFFCYFGPNAPDDDNDGMSDVYEELYGLNPEVDDAAGDLDADGISNGDEHTMGTAANSDDTDGDGLKDGNETGTGVFVSASDTGTSPLSADSDADGLSDGVETRTGIFVSATDTGSDPLKRDTDGDGARDGLEVTTGFDPNDPASIPSVVQGGGVFATTHVWTDGDPEVLDIFEAENILLDPDLGERFDAETKYIHFHDDTSEPPVFVDQSLPFPLWDDENGGAGGFGDHDNFAIRSVGQINVTQGGLVSFICNSDDGFVLRIDGDEVGSAGDRGRADTLMEVDLAAGIHDLEFIYYERGGGAGVSLFVYRGIGTAPDLNDAEWELLPAFGGGSSPFAITDVELVGTKLTVTWSSQPGESFLVETTTDLEEWEEVVDGHPSGGTSTTYVFELSPDVPSLFYVRAQRE